MKCSVTKGNYSVFSIYISIFFHFNIYLKAILGVTSSYKYQLFCVFLVLFTDFKFSFYYLSDKCNFVKERTDEITRKDVILFSVSHNSLILVLGANGTGKHVTLLNRLHSINFYNNYKLLMQTSLFSLLNQLY